jgi:hypothetical protein
MPQPIVPDPGQVELPGSPCLLAAAAFNSCSYGVIWSSGIRPFAATDISAQRCADHSGMGKQSLVQVQRTKKEPAYSSEPGEENDFHREVLWPKSEVSQDH